MRVVGLLLTLVLIACLAFAGWWYLLRRHGHRARTFPVGIVIHHTATPPVIHGKPVDAAFIDGLHAKRGFSVTDTDGRVYHIGYHYLIQQDGTICTGRPEHLHGAHTMGHADMLGIALVGNFQRASNRGRCGPLVPPPAQLRALETLTRQLMRKYDLPANCVFLHHDLCPTACPGDGFPRAEFYRALTQPLAVR